MTGILIPQALVLGADETHSKVEPSCGSPQPLGGCSPTLSSVHKPWGAFTTLVDTSEVSPMGVLANLPRSHCSLVTQPSLYQQEDRAGLPAGSPPSGSLNHSINDKMVQGSEPPGLNFTSSVIFSSHSAAPPTSHLCCCSDINICSHTHLLVFLDPPPSLQDSLCDPVRAAPQ